MTLPKWQSHKIVEAGKIGGIDRADGGGALLILDLPALHSTLEQRVDQAYLDKHDPQVGGYYVRYPGDGYESWSPAEAFEDGYTLLAPEIDLERFATRLIQLFPQLQMHSRGAGGPALAQSFDIGFGFVDQAIEEDPRSLEYQLFSTGFVQARIVENYHNRGEAEASRQLYFGCQSIMLEDDGTPLPECVLAAASAFTNTVVYEPGQTGVYAEPDLDPAQETDKETAAPGPAAGDPTGPPPPTVGRIVQYNDGQIAGGDLWCAAIITYVHSDEVVNLGIWDPNGVVGQRTSVSLGDGYDCWRWPPRV